MTPFIAGLNEAFRYSTTDADFRQMLRDDPHDRQTMGIYADWLDDNGGDSRLLRWWENAKEKVNFPKIVADAGDGNASIYNRPVFTDRRIASLLAVEMQRALLDHYKPEPNSYFHHVHNAHRIAEMHALGLATPEDVQEVRTGPYRQRIQNPEPFDSDHSDAEDYIYAAHEAVGDQSPTQAHNAAVPMRLALATIDADTDDADVRAHVTNAYVDAHNALLKHMNENPPPV